MNKQPDRHAFRRRPAYWVMLVGLVVLLFVGRWAQRNLGGPASDPSPQDAPLVETLYPVERAVDGDTIIVLDGGQRRRVRLTGIDTPEVFDKSGSGERLAKPMPFGAEASAFTKEFIAGGKVELRFGRRRIDQYDRLLAFVFVDERMLNEELARAGLAKAKIYAGEESPLTRRIEKAEEEARAAKRGIWSLDTP